jgi:hypothetical protein
MSRRRLSSESGKVVIGFCPFKFGIFIQNEALDLPLWVGAGTVGEFNVHRFLSKSAFIKGFMNCHKPTVA